MGLKNRYITKEFTFLAPGGAATAIVWRAPFACRVTALRGYRVGGSAAAVNAQKNATDLRSADLSLSSADQWMGGTTSLAAAATRKFAEGDTLKLELVSVGGSPTAVTVQVDITVDSDVR